MMLNVYQNMLRKPSNPWIPLLSPFLAGSSSQHPQHPLLKRHITTMIYTRQHNNCVGVIGLSMSRKLKQMEMGKRHILKFNYNCALNYSTQQQQSSTTTSSQNTNTNPIKIPKEETIIEQAIREAKEDPFQKTDPIKIYSVPALKTEPVSDKSTDSGVKKSLITRIKEEASHYWHGMKLLGKEVSISSRLLVKLLQGNDLSRREQRQLKRTTGDLLRLVPFVIIVLVPFLEFALPILLRLFPNMLPSTFESKTQEEAKKKQLLKVRLEMAKFLQDTVAEVSLSGTLKADAAREFNEFFQKCRMDGTLAPTEEILRVARKFQDSLTLTNLSRPQLVSMAKYMNLTPFGTDAFLRLQIERKLQELHRDDQMIFSEGVENLTLPELQQVCLARGIRIVGVSPARMRNEVQQWVDLHLVHKIPSSLLVLSHAFQTTDRPIVSGATGSGMTGSGSDDPLKDRAEALQATLSSLPHQVVNEASLQVSEAEGVATYKQKLDVLKEQEEMIEDELEQEATQAAAKKAKEEEEASLKKEQQPQPTVVASEATAPQEKQPVIPQEVPQAPVSPTTSEPIPLESQILDSASSTAQANVTGESILAQGADEEDRLSEEELKKLGDALKTRVKSTTEEDIQLSEVKAKLEDLKEERKEFKEDIEELKQVTKKEPVKVSDQLGSRLDKMLAKIEAELAKYDSEIGSKLNTSLSSTDQDTTARTETEVAGQISIEELEEILKVIQTFPNDERIKKIVKQLDSDGDGVVALQEILALVDSLPPQQSTDHGNVTTSSSPQGSESSKS